MYIFDTDFQDNSVTVMLYFQVCKTQIFSVTFSLTRVQGFNWFSDLKSVEMYLILRPFDPSAKILVVGQTGVF